MQITKISIYKAFSKLEFKSLLREPVSMFFMIVVPIVLTIVFGGTFGSEGTSYGENILGIDTIVPVNIVFLLTNVGLMGIPITIIELKEQDVLKRYITYPINFKHYFISLVSAFFFVSLISTLLFSLISFLFYNASWYMNIVDIIIFIPLYLSMVFIFDAIGFLIALIIKGSRTANMVTSGFFLSLIFTSGVAVPVSSLPGIVQKIAYLFPMYHCIEITQMLWISQFSFVKLLDHITYLIILMILIILFLGRMKIKWD